MVLFESLVEQYAAYLKAQPGKTGAGGLPKNARHLHVAYGAKLGLSVKQIEAGMREHYLPRHFCETSDERLRTSVYNALSYAINHRESEAETEQAARWAYLANIPLMFDAKTAAAAKPPFNAPQFHSALAVAVSRCRDTQLKKSLADLAGGLDFAPEHVPALADWLARKLQGYAANDMAGALRASLDISGVPVEHFAECIARVQGAVPDRSQPWAQNLDRDEQGRIKSHIANVLAVLKQHPDWKGRLGYDELKQDCVYWDDDDKKQTWSEDRTTWLRQWFADIAHFTPTKADVIDAVVAVAKLNRSHPVQVYLNSLVWDGSPRIDHWLVTYCAAEDTAYTRAAGAKFLISAVARACEPGCKVDTMLILQSPQGYLKSTTFATLVPDSDWYADTALNIEDRKDAALQLFGKWLYEIGELHGFSKADTNRVKGFMSSKSDNVRAPYAARNEDYPRGCVFGGTTNEETYLTDETGNRRYWPVSVGRCSVGDLARDRDQLWSEAVHGYRAGEPWWLDAAHEALARVEQSSRMVEDTWLQAIEAWLAKPVTGGSGGAWFDLSKGVTTSEVLRHALEVAAERQDRAKANRVGAVLRGLGYRPKRVDGGARRYVKD